MARAGGLCADSECDKTVSVLLNGVETTLSFVDLPLPVQKVSCQSSRAPAAYTLLYGHRLASSYCVAVMSALIRVVMTTTRVFFRISKLGGT